jgi:hypothetical protein
MTFGKQGEAQGNLFEALPNLVCPDQILSADGWHGL